MKPREYCCCAIPIANAGIYAVLVEQLVLGIVAGTLSIATPSSMYYSREWKLFTAADRLYCSRRCCDARSGQMDLRYRLLHWSWDPGVRFHRRLKGEQAAASCLPQHETRMLSLPPFPGEIRSVQTVSVARLVHHHRWIFDICRLDHPLRHSTQHRPS